MISWSDGQNRHGKGGDDTADVHGTVWGAEYVLSADSAPV